jgi:hypothetical protein
MEETRRMADYVDAHCRISITYTVSNLDYRNTVRQKRVGVVELVSRD